MPPTSPKTLYPQEITKAGNWAVTWLNHTSPQLVTITRRGRQLLTCPVDELAPLLRLLTRDAR